LQSAVFQQDNAGVHGDSNTGRHTQSFQRVEKAMKACHLTIPVWVPRSPDLSPIEHLWAVVQRHVVFDPKASPSKFIADVEQAWREIPDLTIKKLLDSMPARIEACIASEGGVFDHRQFLEKAEK
jgi:hypothetical protein